MLLRVCAVPDLVFQLSSTKLTLLFQEISQNLESHKMTFTNYMTNTGPVTLFLHLILQPYKYSLSSTSQMFPDVKYHVYYCT